MQDKRANLEQIAQELNTLEASPLYEYRKENDYHVVLGEGDPDADIMFIGEAPGEQEAKSGRPFVGRSGQVLNELLEMIDLDRDRVYITNVIKDRPPDNRDPRVQEIELYTPFLQRQIEIIEPKVIATLGRFAMEFMLDQFELPLQAEKISDLHGRPIATQIDDRAITLVPLFHPAVALYSRNRRRTLEEDFRVLKRYI
ncbi:MAG TPA: uracil-DNA glycosylase [Candidatus Sulfomarinibacteraceae bacterium]|nr:uracil-DNA glycosylase [Candidatus Sulfomarinibacteraceae bacterium]